MPLRPYGLGTILRGVGRVARAAPAPVAAAVLLVFAVVAAAGLAAGPFERFTRTTDDLGQPHLSVHVSTGPAILASFGVLGGLLAAAIAVQVALQTVAGGNARPGRAGLRALVPYLVVVALGIPQSVLLVLGRGRPGLTLLGYVVAIGSTWLTVGLSLAPSAAVAEGLSPRAALVRSWRLVRGSWWRTFGIRLVLELVGVAPGAIVGALVGVLAVNGGDGTRTFPGSGLVVVLAALSSLSVCAVAVGTPLIYVDLRCRREGLAWSLDSARRGDGRPVLGAGGVYEPFGPISPTGGPSGS